MIIISGATATGKTSLSLKIADLIRDKTHKKSCIINFDSLLFYKELNIGTAKPSLDERKVHPHYLVDIASIKAPINAHDFIKLAEEKIENCFRQGILPILVGGSAFYLRALIKGMYESQSINQELKDEVSQAYQNKGIGPIRDFLKKYDLDSYNSLHENDHYRLIRAYEYYRQTSSPLSMEKKKFDELNPYDLSHGIHKDWDTHHIYLEIPRDEHWPYITNRTKEMFNSGLVLEVETLLKAGFTGDEKPLKSIGYIETVKFLKGNFTSEEEYLERISISTRQLAKSQRTFFNKITPKKSYHPLKDENRILSEVISFTEKLEFSTKV